MELENIVANTVYLKAREGGSDSNKGKSKKWRRLLQFPHISQCLDLKSKIDVRYSYIIDQQPIGRLLFRQFCEVVKPVYHKYNLFLDDVERYQVEVDEKRQEVAHTIFNKYLKQTCSEWHIVGILNETLTSTCKENLDTAGKELFLGCAADVKLFLANDPFKEFEDSMYFHRYLQWKWLESQPVTYKTFRMYRVLGKGGFGEVCACQVRATGKMYACKNWRKNASRNGKGKPWFSSKSKYCKKLIQDLCHLHTQGIVYRDCKPENILLDDHGHVRISDLGLAVQIPEGEMVRGRVGTVGYMAPEVIDNEKYTFSPDWFSFGCLIYEMIEGQAPFRARKEK
ncbi:hypothetical protein Pmani_038242, partial [Petrolisthes manimaculis]